MEIKNAMYQNLCDTDKAVLTGIFIELNAYIRKEEKSQINLNSHLKNLQSEEQSKSKSRRKE